MPEERQPGLTRQEVHERVRARFPELVVRTGRGPATHDLPTDSRLTKALKDAGFDVTLATHAVTGTVRYLPTRMDHASSHLTSGTWPQSATTHAVTRHDDDAELAAEARAKEQLASSARQDGYRVLTVRSDLSRRATKALRTAEGNWPGVEVVSVTGLFLDALHELVPEGTKPTWETLLKADAAEPRSKGAVKFAGYARTAWGAVEPRVRALLDASAGSGPVLLTEATAFARYDAMGVLDRCAEAARQGGRGLWLLVPQSDPSREPKLGHVAVAYQAGFGEWITLPDRWVKEAYSAEAARRVETQETEGDVAK
jgi:hypothetical protein